MLCIIVIVSRRGFRELVFGEIGVWLLLVCFVFCCCWFFCLVLFCFLVMLLYWSSKRRLLFLGVQICLCIKWRVVSWRCEISYMLVVGFLKISFVEIDFMAKERIVSGFVKYVVGSKLSFKICEKLWKLVIVSLVMCVKLLFRLQVQIWECVSGWMRQFGQYWFEAI